MFGFESLRACAKINLCLDIIGKRPDGYHLLESVMQSLTLHDSVKVWLNKCGRIRVICKGMDIPEEKNIAYKAAVKFYEKQDIPLSKGVTVKISKKIPSQAGMGGGSADAAAVLVALNRIFKTKLSENELCEIGKEVGADVPFCICGGTCLVRGIGEIITRLVDFPNSYFVIVKGSDGVLTKQAYDEFDNAENLRSVRIEKVIEAINVGDINLLKDRLINVFEDSTSIKEISQIVNRLKTLGALDAAMTGSGSAVFGIFDDKKIAKECAKQLKNEYSFAAITTPSVKGVATGI